MQYPCPLFTRTFFVLGTVVELKCRCRRFSINIVIGLSLNAEVSDYPISLIPIEKKRPLFYIIMFLNIRDIACMECWAGDLAQVLVLDMGYILFRNIGSIYKNCIISIGPTFNLIAISAPLIVPLAPCLALEKRQRHHKGR